MDPRDLFRGLFGFDRHRFDGSERRGGSSNDRLFDNGDEYEDGSDIDDMFQHFHDEMHTQMEHLNQQMEEMFKQFGATDFPSVLPGPPSPPNQPESPRDRMLKDPAEKAQISKSPFVSPPDQPSLFGRLFSIPRFENIQQYDKVDKDLDSMDGKDLSKILVKPNDGNVKPGHSPGLFSGHRSVSITTVRGADGKLEQKKTVRDSEGNEETTITRQVGDQTHTVQTRKDGLGVVEEKETFHNIEKDDLKTFEDRWQDKGRQSMRDKMILPKPDSDEDSSIFKKLFGFDFKKSDS